MRIPRAHPFFRAPTVARTRGSKVVKGGERQSRSDDKQISWCTAVNIREGIVVVVFIACFLRSNSGRCQNQTVKRFHFRSGEEDGRWTLTFDPTTTNQPLDVGFARVSLCTHHEPPIHAHGAWKRGPNFARVYTNESARAPCDFLWRKSAFATSFPGISGTRQTPPPPLSLSPSIPSSLPPKLFHGRSGLKTPLPRLG